MPILSRTNSAIFDLAHLATLSGVPSRCLFVSDKTLYVLQNLVVADVISLSRYARVVLDGGYYIPCDPWSDEYPAVLEIIEGVETEVYPMACYAYTGVYAEWKSLVRTEDGTEIYQFTVPENELWEVQSAAAKNNTHLVVTQIAILQVGGAPGSQLFYKVGTVTGAWEVWTGKAVLSAGMILQIALVGNATGDTTFAAIHVAKLVLS